MAILALASSATLIVTAIFLWKRNRYAFDFGLAILSAIGVLYITGEFGLLDLFALLVSLVPVGLMLRDRAWYLQAKRT